MQFQFPGRLFDRDTLILMTFEVNFMYILHAFGTGNDVSNARAALRSHFRKGFMETLESLYEIKPLENVTAEFVVQNFHEFNGKVFYDNANKDLYQPLRDCRYRRDAATGIFVTNK